MKVFLFLLTFFVMTNLLAQSDPCQRDPAANPELEAIMAGVTPIINTINECDEREDIEDQYRRGRDEAPTWPEALLENPAECIKGLFAGLVESVVDIGKFLYSLLQAFLKAMNATFYATYNFLRAAFTGNLSYWFSEASNGAMDFINTLFDSIKAIPQAIGSFFQDKVDKWNCLNGPGQSQFACKMVGYVGGDALISALTLGTVKAGLIGKISRGVQKQLGLNKTRQARNMYEDPKNPITHIPKRNLGDLIPENMRDRRFVVETDASGHYSVRYYGADGKPRMFDGSPFYHYFANSRLRRQGIGTNRNRLKGNLRAAEHFTVDVPPEKFQDLMNYIERTEGTFSMACTRTACESMKAAGVDLGQKPVPSIDRLYKDLVQEARTNPQITQVPSQLTEADRAVVIDRFRRNTNVVKFNFAMTSVAGYFYGGAALGTAPTFVIDTMSSHTPENAQQSPLTP